MIINIKYFNIKIICKEKEKLQFKQMEEQIKEFLL